MLFKNSLLFLILYFLTGYLAIFLDSALLHGKITPAANCVVLIVAIRISFFNYWIEQGAKTGLMIGLSAFSAFVTITHLHILHYISIEAFNVNFEQMNLAWTMGTFLFNFLLSMACLKVLQNFQTKQHSQ